MNRSLGDRDLYTLLKTASVAGIDQERAYYGDAITLGAAELSLLQAQEALEEAADVAALEQAVAGAELQLAQKEADLDVARTDLRELTNWAPDETEVEIATANLAIAQADYQVVVAKANMSEDQTASIRVNFLRPFFAGEGSRYVGSVVRVGRNSAIGDAQAVSDDGKVAIMARITGYR